ncbi:hypothetical protein [Methyloversatilis discipulorum]|uniref:hypothetical protein n=1 Tax=Methyloversatilis discipulorum TaxID=1119528 RepID=UPI0012F9A06F|nr:hypothetical protein [Methyloversatilis discipulorum]
MVTERQIVEATDSQEIKLGLFQVWIDVNCGLDAAPDWWWNSEPQPLQGALNEAAECRDKGVPARVMPEGMNPRPDGRWDNPC